MSELPCIALVEDDPILLDILTRALIDQGFDVHPFPDGASFVGSLDAGLTPDAAVLDIVMPGVDGLEALERLRADVPACRVVMMTAFKGVDNAVESLRLGATEYLMKPITAGEVISAVKQALRKRRGGEEVREAAADFAADTDERDLAVLMGPGRAVEEIKRFVVKAAVARVPVLLTGETGTGKELVARAIHASGPRSEKAMVIVNCGAIPEALMEAELFGYRKGAFTGAEEDRSGMIGSAEGSTLFLDEVGDLPLQSQVKLLRVLQEGQVRAVGARQPTPVDIRVVAATNRDLEQEIAAGRFRTDLYYRLGVLRLRLPALRERREDLPHLVERFMTAYGRADGPRKVAARALKAFKRYPWPGNVRELENELARINTLVDDPAIEFRHLSPEIRAAQEVRGAGSLRAALDLKERGMILAILERAGWNKSEAARMLGMSRQNLYQRMDYHNIPRQPASMDGET
ncbi:MAG: sigma-54 dependent transcriptional regulator [bacterium]